jgi:tripeptidyl-peptidase I
VSLSRQNLDAFNDVTSGVNNGDYPLGFEAAKGWDPASGVGTPNFDLLKAKLGL